MMLSLLLWVQQSSTGWHWTGDEIRTWLIGIMTAMVAAALRVLWTLRDEVRDLKPTVRQIEEKIDLHEREIRWLTGKRIAQEAIEEAERQNYQGDNRRRAYRRDRDIVNEALSRSDEHQYPEG
jgi:hypothetical protein